MLCIGGQFLKVAHNGMHLCEYSDIELRGCDGYDVEVDEWAFVINIRVQYGWENS